MALSGIAAENLEQGSGIASRTIASLEHQWARGRDQLGAGDVLVIDEAGMIGSPPWPYSDKRLLPYLNHSLWFLPNVAACHAMANLLAEDDNVFWHEFDVIVAAGAGAGIGLDALPPVRNAIGSGHDTKTITLSCGKLTTYSGLQ